MADASGSFIVVEPERRFVDDESAMELALAYASEALEVGDLAVAAVVLDADGRVLAARHDEVRSSKDPTAHASALALRDAAATRGSWRVLDAQLIVTREPCAFCAGAALAARVARVVVGARDEHHGCLGSRYQLGADPRLNHEFAVRSDVLSDRCAAVFRRSLVNGVGESDRAV
jgi:tRNA(adenine34) deaminase